ncbi:MAG TPA: ABC transporter permease, partial [Anaerolineaceae bacterium]
QGDVYISAPGFNSNTAAAEIDPTLVSQISLLPGVARADLLRVTRVSSPSGEISLSASNNPSTGSERLYKAKDGTAEAVWAAMQNGAVVVSEPLANRLGLPLHGGSLVLLTPAGPRSFPVNGIFYDYSSSEGTAVMSMDVFRRIWKDNAVTAIGLRLLPGTQAESITRAVQDLLDRQPGSQHLIVRSNATLRGDVLAVFDRTFAITGALNILATIVAFIGVLSSLLLLQLDKQREVGILRVIGLTARQLWGLVMLETGLMGFAAGLLAMPTGYVLSLILIYIINRRSFGWTLQMNLVPGPFLEALAVAVAAALLAGLYPAFHEAQMPAVEVGREQG